MALPFVRKGLRNREIAEQLKELPERERRILYLRFFRNMSQSAIAEDIGKFQFFSHVLRVSGSKQVGGRGRRPERAYFST